ncbi:hypothetical protein LCGC14_2133850 [marine sediment metagenome]|uniref:IrrE N-terminal-like domain-containing protein n=1 Tax=marine sediment metagenome TaxID=412755 RepID=A0A0F9GWM7_9ZZZZ
MFNLPTRLRIGSWYFQCSRIPMDDDGRNGYNSDGGGYLKVNECLQDDKAASATFHEISHLALEQHHVKLSEEVEEQVCVAFEETFVGLAKDEQKFVQHMFKEMGKL